MEPDTTPSPEQEAFLRALGQTNPNKPNPPPAATLAEWLKQKPFRRRYRAARDAMIQELILFGLDQYLHKARQVRSNQHPSSSDKDGMLAEKRADDVRKCAVRLLLSERSLRKRKRDKSADASDEDDLDGLTFEEAIARILPPGADVDEVTAFFRSRAEATAPPDPSPPAQMEQNIPRPAVV